MEINGRLWGSLPLAVASGVDFPLYLYQMLVLGRTAFPQAYRTGLYCRNLVNDLAWLRLNLRSDRADATALRVGLGQVVGELTNLVLLRERSDTFVLDDPGPGVHQLTQLAGAAVERLRGRLIARLARTGPARRITRRRVLSALRGGGKLLVVCKGNICRSPYAQRAAARLLPSTIEVRAAGYFPRGGRPSPPEAVAAASRRGVDLSGHRSVVVDATSVAAASAIAVFDAENRREILRRFPAAAGKVFFLGSFLSTAGLQIDDPWGEPASAYDRAYESIDEALAGLTRLLLAR